jgi:hypothetical protein
MANLRHDETRLHAFAHCGDHHLGVDRHSLILKFNSPLLSISVRNLHHRPSGSARPFALVQLVQGIDGSIAARLISA